MRFLRMAAGAGIFVWVNLFYSAPAQAQLPEGWQPWDELVSDSWIGPAVTTQMYPFNTANTWTIEFKDAALTGPQAYQAKGMNALRFDYQGQNTGHLFTRACSGGFAVRNFSSDKTYHEFLLLVVVKDETLPDNFAFSLSAHEPNQWDATLDRQDFIFYHQPSYDTGRPSGYYSVTDPNSEPLASVFDIADLRDRVDPNGPRRDFNSAMVSLVELNQVTLAPGGGSVVVYYQLDHLTVPATIYIYSGQNHIVNLTNRAVIDNHNPAEPISTLEFIPLPGDLDGDGDVDIADLARLTIYWLNSDCAAPDWCSLADHNHSGTVNMADFACLANFWLAGIE